MAPEAFITGTKRCPLEAHVVLRRAAHLAQLIVNSVRAVGEREQMRVDHHVELGILYVDAVIRLTRPVR